MYTVHKQQEVNVKSGYILQCTCVFMNCSSWFWGRYRRV